MRDNLIFEGIVETLEKNTEEVLREFLKSEMDITEEPQFQRVHRMGKRVQGRHRPIIAKFVLFKEREKKSEKLIHPNLLENHLELMNSFQRK